LRVARAVLATDPDAPATPTTRRPAGASARRLARIAGGIYLLNIVAGFFAIGVVPAMVVVPGDVAATLQNIQAHEPLYRLGLAAHLLPILTNVPLVVILYDLLKVVDRRVALLMVLYSVVGTAVECANLLNQFAPLVLLDGARGSHALTAEQALALAYAPLGLTSAGYNVQQVVYAFFLLPAGYLVFRSAFLPRTVGVLVALGAVAYLTYSFTTFLSPGSAPRLVPYIQLPSLVGEGSLCLWLLVMGVNVRRWTDRARTHASTEVAAAVGAPPDPADVAGPAAPRAATNAGPA
jgi:hypothetical protein